MRLVAILVLALLALPLRAEAQSQDTPARSAIILDLTSGAVLFEKNPDEPLPPASMSKLMTLNMAFEALAQGRLSLEDKFRTSKYASGMGGSKMFLREGGIVRVEDLVRGVIVQSGNDAAVAIAEALAGTEEGFAAQMNARAREIGLENSHFSNATGWPDPAQRMSSRDLATLAARLITEFPQFYPYFAEREFTWDGVRQSNRNPLLTLGVGADGLKTGHTEEAGYGLVASAKRGLRRVVLVVTGLKSTGERRHEAERLINWAFRAFETRQLFESGQALAEADVWIGSSDRVTLAPSRDIIVTAPFGTLDDVELKVRYDGPVPAPIAAGTTVGHVEITVPGLKPNIIPLVTTHGVEEGGFLPRVQAAGELLLRRVLPELGG